MIVPTPKVRKATPPTVPAAFVIPRAQDVAPRVRRNEDRHVERHHGNGAHARGEDKVVVEPQVPTVDHVELDDVSAQVAAHGAEVASRLVARLEQQAGGAGCRRGARNLDAGDAIR